MVPAGVLVALVCLACGVTDAIRTLKEGPMIDAEGREYKSGPPADKGRAKFSDKPTIRVQCTEVSMIIFIQADFYRTGRLVAPGELFLGDAKHSKSSRCQAVPVGDKEYVIDADLQDCGSTLTISDDDVIYSNNLRFSPAVGSYGITRMSEAVVPISCHYKRKHTVSSTTPQQEKPLTFSTAGGSPFSLKLMTANWLDERFPNTFLLGEPLHLKAWYSGPDSRQLFVDSCVATLTPDPTSVPRYYFIENHGCFTDARDGGLNSVFLPRSSANSLQFKFDAFLFYNELRNTIYITCKLKATRQLMKSSPVNKVCNYAHSRWMNVDGSDSMCWCCNSVCQNRQSKDDVICDTLTLGPLLVFPRKW